MFHFPDGQWLPPTWAQMLASRDARIAELECSLGRHKLAIDGLLTHCDHLQAAALACINLAEPEAEPAEEPALPPGIKPAPLGITAIR